MTDEVVYEKGNDADAMFFLVSGQIEALDAGARTAIGPDADDAGNGGSSQSSDKSAAHDAKGSASIGAAKAQRLVYMAGEDFGVEGLLDSSFRWDLDARVCSRKAVLLELAQEDFEVGCAPLPTGIRWRHRLILRLTLLLLSLLACQEMLVSDPALNESAGEMLRRVNQLKEPKSLALLWPFYGVPHASLEAVSVAFEPEVAFDGTLLCEPPMDPCQALRVVVHGKIVLLRAAAPGGSSEGQTESAGSGECTARSNPSHAAALR